MKEKYFVKSIIKNIPTILRRIIPLMILVVLSAIAADAAIQTAIITNSGAAHQVNAVANTDLSVSIADSPDPAMRGENVTYTFTVLNLTGVDAQNFTLTAYVSNYSSFVSFSAPNGFNCTTPNVGETDPVNCSAATVAGGSTNIFTLVLKIANDAPINASLYEPVNIAASNDTNGQNNSAAEVTDLTGGVFVSTVNGDYQTTNINTPFATNLKVRVTDGNNNPLSGVTVTFTAPTNGASGTFTGGVTTVDVQTDQNGYATAPVFTANGIAGSYTVTATTQNANGSASFNLTNVAPMTYTVTNTNDDGAGSLRQAVEDANDNSGNDTIVFEQAVFSTKQSIFLTSGEIEIFNNGSLTVNGPGANLLTIFGSTQPGNESRIFNIHSANSILNDLSLEGGFANEDVGGAILASGGKLQINRCVFNGNTADDGGGAIGSVATNLTISQSTFSNNNSLNSVGGAIFIFSVEGFSTTKIINSTFNQNSAAQGGAIYKGRPIFGGDPLQLNMTSVTIAGNTASGTGGGIFVEEGNFNVINTIIAGNTGGDINGEVNSQGYNLIQSTAGTTFSGGQPKTTDIIGQSPLLEPLADNGGTTRTMRPMTNSPVIDKGTAADIQFSFVKNGKISKKSQTDISKISNIAAVTTDQRGVMRPIDNPNVTNAADGADIGAFETLSPTAAGTEISGRVLINGGRGLNNAKVYLTDGAGRNFVVITNAFGYFRFPDIAAGQTCILQVGAKNYQFAPQVVNISENLTDLIITAIR